MGMFDSVRLRLSAALSPQQMTQQRSKPKKSLSGTNEMFNIVYQMMAYAMKIMIRCYKTHRSNQDMN